MPDRGNEEVLVGLSHPTSLCMQTTTSWCVICLLSQAELHSPAFLFLCASSGVSYKGHCLQRVRKREETAVIICTHPTQSHPKNIHARMDTHHTHLFLLIQILTSCCSEGICRCQTDYLPLLKREAHVGRASTHLEVLEKRA